MSSSLLISTRIFFLLVLSFTILLLLLPNSFTQPLEKSESEQYETHFDLNALLQKNSFKLSSPCYIGLLRYESFIFSFNFVNAQLQKQGQFKGLLLSNYTLLESLFEQQKNDLLVHECSTSGGDPLFVALTLDSLDLDHREAIMLFQNKRDLVQELVSQMTTRVLDSIKPFSWELLNHYPTLSEMYFVNSRAQNEMRQASSLLFNELQRMEMLKNGKKLTNKNIENGENVENGGEVVAHVESMIETVGKTNRLLRMVRDHVTPHCQYHMFQHLLTWDTLNYMVEPLEGHITQRDIKDMRQKFWEQVNQFWSSDEQCKVHSSTFFKIVTEMKRIAPEKAQRFTYTTYVRVFLATYDCSYTIGLVSGGEQQVEAAAPVAPEALESKEQQSQDQQEQQQMEVQAQPQEQQQEQPQEHQEQEQQPEQESNNEAALADNEQTKVAEKQQEQQEQESLPTNSADVVGSTTTTTLTETTNESTEEQSNNTDTDVVNKNDIVDQTPPVVNTAPITSGPSE